LDDLVIEQGYHHTPQLANFTLLHIGGAGDNDLREQLIDWGFAHHPHISQAHDDHYIGGEFDFDDGDDGGDFVSQYEFLTSFTDSWHDDTPPSDPPDVSLHQRAESAALDFAISRAADERRSSSGA